MAMQIHGNYDHSGIDYAERVKEKQADQRAEKAKEAEKAAEEKNAEIVNIMKKSKNFHILLNKILWKNKKAGSIM